eukprot:1325535-Amorphochlora_amoeboformis.AAC.1
MRRCGEKLIFEYAQANEEFKAIYTVEVETWSIETFYQSPPPFRPTSRSKWAAPSLLALLFLD